jgi:hypothetical protein
MRTVKGTWVSFNLFITEDNERIEVYPYKKFAEQYQRKWPLDCYLLLDNDEIINLVEC